VGLAGKGRDPGIEVLNNLAPSRYCAEMPGPRFFPEDPHKLKSRIRTYERALRGPDQRDGYGKRYLIGPMYLLLEDVSGALNHYRWLKRNYPDDMGDPYDQLCWALALHRAGDPSAEEKLRDAIFKNLYLVPILLEIQVEPYPIWHGCNLEEIEYADAIPGELLKLWDDAAKAWARAMYESKKLQIDLKRYIELEAEVKDEPPGPKRSALLEEAWAIARGTSEKKRSGLRIVRGSEDQT
jgi:hypothetical protein